MSEQNRTDLNILQQKAWATLQELLENPSTPAAIRLQAAHLIVRRTSLPETRATRAQRQAARFDSLCADLAPHQALAQLRHPPAQNRTDPNT